MKIKTIQMWIAQDFDGECFLFKKKPKNMGGPYPNWQGNKESAKAIGENLLSEEQFKKQPIHCTLMMDKEDE